MIQLIWKEVNLRIYQPFLSKDVYENSVKLVSFTKRERAIRLSEYTNDNNEETYKTYDIRPRNYDPWNSYIENYKYAEWFA